MRIAHVDRRDTVRLVDSRYDSGTGSGSEASHALAALADDTGRLADLVDLARRGVAVRLIDKAPHAFDGSRAKGVQPRTLEVLEDLGALPDVNGRQAAHPRGRLAMGGGVDF